MLEYRSKAFTHHRSFDYGFRFKYN
jgi:hypothetical protein